MLLIARATRAVRCVLGATALAVALGAEVLSISPLQAQAAVGFGDDAVTLPAGMVRLGFLNDWTRFEQRITAGDGSSVDVDARVRSTPIALDFGVLDRLTIGALVPSVGTYGVVTWYPAVVSAGHADSVRMFGQSAIGDAEVWAKLVWIGEQSEAERTRPAGFHVRSAVTGLVRLGTGTPAHASHRVAIGTGDAQADVGAASQWDLIFGRRFWLSLTGRYVRQLPVTRVVRVAPRDDPFSDAVLASARIEPGDYYELEATPRLSLGQHFMLSARYVHRHDDATSYTADDGSIDASILDVASTSATVYGFGIVYSSVASYVAGRTSIPLEVTLQYSHTDRWLSGVPPSIFATPARSTLSIGARFYARVWGRRR